jgi:hypothetical protein
MHQKWASNLLQYESFRGRMGDLVSLQEQSFSERLHGVKRLGRIVNLSYEHDLAEAPFA